MKKVVLWLSALLVVSGSIMFYIVDMRRTVAREQRRRDREAIAAMVKVREQQLLAARRLLLQTPLPAPEPSPTAENMSQENMAEIIRQAPIQVEHFKKSDKIQQIVDSLQARARQQTDRKTPSETIPPAVDRLAKWKSQLAQTGFKITSLRAPSNSPASQKAQSQLSSTLETDVILLPANKVVPTCDLLKNPKFSVALRIDGSGNVVAWAPVSPNDTIPGDKVQKCKFSQPLTRQKVAMYKTVITPTMKKSVQQAKL